MTGAKTPNFPSKILSFPTSNSPKTGKETNKTSSFNPEDHSSNTQDLISLLKAKFPMGFNSSNSNKTLNFCLSMNSITHSLGALATRHGILTDKVILSKIKAK